MLSKILIFFICLTSVAWAQEEEPGNLIELKSLKEKLEYEFKSLESQVGDVDFEKVLEDLGKRTKQYIHFRKLECEGEFSTIEINDQGESVVKKKKLSKVETKLCMLELINFQRQYSNVIFDLRKKMLLKQHAEQIQLLEKYRQESVEELEKMAAGYR